MNLDDDDVETPEIAALRAAAEACRIKAEGDPNDVNLAALGKAYADLGATEQALACYGQAITLNGKNSAFMQAKAAVHLSEGDTAEAQELLKQALQLSPNSSSILFDLGRSYQIDEDQVKAVEYFTQAMAKDPRNSNAVFQVAVAHLNASKQDDALKLFLQVAHDDPSNLGAFDKAGQILFHKGGTDNLKQAAELYQKASVLEPSDAQFRAKIIQCYDSLNMVKEREAARGSMDAAYQKNQLNPNFTAVGRYCCGQFEVGDKFVMAFDYLKLLGPEPPKYQFTVFNKGQLHEDKALYRVTLSSKSGSYELASIEKKQKKIYAEFKGNVPAYQDIKDFVVKIITNAVQPTSSVELK